MKINNLIYIVLLGIIVSLTSCEDDDSLFSGNENYITSFRLVQQGDSYAGIIKGDSLILSIPENLSLEGAIMEIVVKMPGYLRILVKLRIGESYKILQ